MQLYTLVKNYMNMHDLPEHTISTKHTCNSKHSEFIIHTVLIAHFKIPNK